jgi:hypothetical protein
MAKQHVRCWRVSRPMADIAKSTRLTQSGPSNRRYTEPVRSRMTVAEHARTSV